MSAPEPSARALVAAIVAAMEDGDTEAAAALAGQGLAAFDAAAVFHRWRGMALFALGGTAEAKEHLNAALSVDPLDNAASLALVAIADAEDDPYTAAEHMLTAWEHDPADPSLRDALTGRLAALYGPEGHLQYTRPALAALYVRNAYPERAAREYHAILEEQPARLDVRLAAALAAWTVGDLPETVARCETLLAEHPRTARARWALADTLARQGKGEAAREHAKQAALLDPDGAIARQLIARNPAATIVDPDEPVRAPEDWPPHISVLPLSESAAVAVTVSSEEATQAPPSAEEEKSETMRLVEMLTGLAAMLAPPDDAAEDHGATTAPADVVPVGPTMPPDEPVEPAPLVLGGVPPRSEEPVERIEAISALTAALPNPQELPRPEERQAEEAMPSDATLPPEPVVAVVEGDGAIVAALPGAEPLLTPDDALPAPPEPSTPPAPPHAWGGADRGDPDAMMRTQIAAGNGAAAIAGLRAVLVAAGDDAERVRALLPLLRALVDLAPTRPDARRLLGDAYARLGQYAQAQGQYRQALLVRVAGKGKGGNAAR